MDACPLLITSIVAVKPEDQGTFFQDFLGLSGYLCSVPEMLRTTMKPNETVEKPLVRKTFIKISHNWLKTRQNVVRNTKNQTLFSVSVPFFKIIFERGLFRQFQRLALPVAAEKQAGKRKTVKA
jgi:hypothetical protein